MTTAYSNYNLKDKFRNLLLEDNIDIIQHNIKL